MLTRVQRTWIIIHTFLQRIQNGIIILENNFKKERGKQTKQSKEKGRKKRGVRREEKKLQGKKIKQATNYLMTQKLYSCALSQRNEICVNTKTHTPTLVTIFIYNNKKSITSRPFG